MADLRKFVHKLDLFRRIDEEYLTSATAHGATFSLISYLLMIALGLFEFSAYLSSTTTTSVLVDVNMEQSLLIKFNITMLALPCKLLAVETYDELSWGRQSAQGDVQMTRIHMAHGNYIIGAKLPSNWKELDEKKHDVDTKDVADEQIEVDIWGHHALDLRGEKHFDEELEIYHYTLINFYTRWCLWCKAMVATYEKAAVEFDSLMLKEHKHIKAKFASVNCENFGSLCTKYRVIAYPTLIIFNHKDPIYPAYDGARNVKSLVKFLKDAVINAEVAVPETYHDHACRIEGVLKVPRVPGNFHIEAASTDQDMSPQMANLSHTVHTLQFGERVDPALEHRLEKKQQLLLHPLNGKDFILHKRHLAPQHYIQVVTTLYDLGDEKQIQAYQFTSQNRIAEYTNEEIPEAKFSYVLSPVSVVVNKRRTPFYSFITSLLAIVGGTFTMISLLNTILDKFGDHLKKHI